ncbi:MAG: hypothetical protein ABSD72_01385 [Terracidiphilus sp.]|jgi:hypothetical protein
MGERLVDQIPFAKIITVLAIIFGISLGLCGVTVVLSDGGNRGGSFFIGLQMLVIAGILLSLTCLLLTVLAFVTLSILGSFSGKVSQPVRLFAKEDDTKIDKNE